MRDLIYNYFRYFFKNSIYSLYFILIVVVSSHAINLRENTQLYFEQIALKQGLPQSAITCLYQDKTGYIWIGTTDGLSRYNGYSFENYRNEPFDTTSISTGQVQALLEDSRENLWIGSSDGLSRLDQKKGTFHHIALLNSPVNILAMVEGPDGYIWISGLNVGLIRLHPEVGTITRFQKKTNDRSSLNSNEILGLYVDIRQNLWAFSVNGLNLWLPESEKFKSFFFSETDHTPNHVQIVNDIREVSTADTLLWLATNNGLVKFDPANGRTTRYNPPMWLSEPDNVVALSVDPFKPQILWLATEASGLWRFDSEKGTFQQFRHNPANPNSIGGNSLSDMIIDHSGVLWITLNSTSGLCKLNLQRNTFLLFQHATNGDRENNIVSVATGPDNLIFWVGTQGTDTPGELHQINRRTGQITRFYHSRYNQKSVPDNFGINRLYVTPENQLWLGTMGNPGILAQLTPTGDFISYRPDPADTTSLPDNFVIAGIWQAPDGFWWIGTNNGLSKLNPEMKQIAHHRHRPNNSNGLSDNFITVFYQTTDTMLWVGTQNGLNRLNWRNNKVTAYHHSPTDATTLSGPHITALAERPQEPGIIWIGTTNGGLNRLNPKTNEILHITIRNGLPHNTIRGILPDSSGNLWLTTPNGLAQYHPESGRIKIFNEEHGLQSLKFNPTAYAMSQDGWMYFGGSNGLNAFNPQEFQNNPLPPRVTLENVTIFGIGIGHDADASKTYHLAGGDSLEMNHNERNFIFRFTGLHYSQPEDLYYAIRMKNFDDGWRHIGKQRSATYTNMHPGKYVFQVNVRTNDGLWGEEIAEVNMEIRQPWWWTSAAFLAYLLLFAGIISFVYQFERNRIRKKEHGQTKMREAELRAQAAEARAQYLKLENERKKEELEKARKLQMSMLPKALPQLPQLEIRAFMQTATEVGGDYYDFAVDDNEMLTLIIGDATGHGTQAGTVVTATKALLSVLYEEADLEELMHRATHAMRKMNFPRLYMALALGRLRGDQLELIGAGMPPALIYREKTNIVESVELKGMPLGGNPQYKYRTYYTCLDPGDTLLMMSDGFPELFNSRQEMLGYDSPKHEFRKVAHQEPQEILNHFVRFARQWTNGLPFEDDVTFLVLKMNKDVDWQPHYPML